MNFFKRTFFLTFIFICNSSFSAVFLKQFKYLNKDSISIYLKKVEDKSLSIDKRIFFVDSIYNFSTRFNNDSLKNKALKNYIKLNFINKDWEKFNKYRTEHLKFTKDIDSFSLDRAKTLEFSGYYFKMVFDMSNAYSSYFKGYTIYSDLNDSLKAGKVLLNLAIIQMETHDYIGSEQSSFKSLKYLKSSTNLRRISSVYNNLGIVYKQLNDKKNSINYYTKALELRKQITSKPMLEVQSYNNLGNLYINLKDYKKAINYFEKALTYKYILEKNQNLKGLVIDNYTYARFKNGETNGILKSFFKALKIREENNYLNDIAINCIHLAEYYKNIGNYNEALVYADRAKYTAKSTHNFYDYLFSIQLLGSLQKTKKEKDMYFEKYINVRDSLDLIAKNHKEQFARIRFETDEKETVILSQKNEIKNKQVFLIITGIIFVIVGIGLFIVFQNKNRKQKKIEKELVIDFDEYITQKYNLTKENLELWKNLVSDLNQDELALKLGLKINGLKSRRKSLRDKIILKRKIKGNFDKSKAIIFYKEEQEFYNKNSPKSNKKNS